MVKEPRCPYCVWIDGFMLMNATGDGHFVCAKCGHVAIPGDRIFQCLCSHCEAMRAFRPTNTQLWSKVLRSAKPKLRGLV